MNKENQIDINLKFNCDQSGLEAAKQGIDDVKEKLTGEANGLDSELARKTSARDEEEQKAKVKGEDEQKAKVKGEDEQMAKVKGEDELRNLNNSAVGLRASTSTLSEAKTSEGDQVRKQAAERSAELEKQIQALTEELRKSNEQAAKLRQDAKNTREKAAAMGGALEAAEIEGDTARKTAARGESAAQAALDKNHAEQAAEAAKIADAEKARALLSVQKQNLQAQIAAQQQKKDAAAFQVFQAQGTMDAARLGGNRGMQQSAFANLQAAQDAAQNVNHAADTAINALTTTLKNVEARLKAAQNFLESQSKQQRNAWSEAPAGE